MKRPNEQATDRTRGGTARSAGCRAVAFLVCWLALTGGEPADLLAGAAAVAASTWTSLRLIPPERGSIRPLLFIAFVARFLVHAVWAGADVAWRALAPRLPLQPGTVSCAMRLPPGTKRNAFCAVTSLLPGTLPSGRSADGDLLVHCLDLTQPVAGQLAAEEARFADMLGGTGTHD